MTETKHRLDHSLIAIEPNQLIYSSTLSTLQLVHLYASVAVEYTADMLKNKRLFIILHAEILMFLHIFATRSSKSKMILF